MRKGDKVSAKQEIGEVFTNNAGETMLGFGVFKEYNPENPASWIFEM